MFFFILCVGNVNWEFQKNTAECILQIISLNLFYMLAAGIMAKIEKWMNLNHFHHIVFIKPRNDTITVSGGSVAGGSGSLEGKIVIVTSGTKFQVPIYFLL